MKLSATLGGGHGHHEPFKVPHYTVYNNYRQCPELLAHEERLGRLGLKDPWIRFAICVLSNGLMLLFRNFVHLFHPNRPRRGRFEQMWFVSYLLDLTFK